ncbi:hypothetical protein HWV62_22690 [Athelia sp. TMB]|nr:hypothetical protein HWV62_22690 [Athelia sp. TMB]
MAIFGPATPGFLVTLIATVLLAIVSFNVPYLKSVYFLKASLSVEGLSGNLTLGTLGYCMELSNGTTCSKPSIGYELGKRLGAADINALVGDKISKLQIPNIAVKWITYALFLHVVALILAAISALFGLLAHVREMAMTCFSSCIAGFGAVVALIAFIFDLAFFFVAKSRLNAVSGGHATIGVAIWLTLASWLLLFFSGCFYGIGRCCISRRPPKQYDDQRGVEDGYASQMRLDAVKAEADRKNRQRAGEVGLPAFHEYDASQPLHAVVDGDEVYAEGAVPYRDNVAGAGQNTGYAPAGYVQGAAGHRAIDEYNSPSSPTSSYPPQPRRTGSAHTQTTSGYAPSQHNPGYNGATPPVPEVNSQYLNTAPNQGHDAYASQDYGHTQAGSSYYNPSHQQYPSNQYDAYGGGAQPGRVTSPPFSNTYNAPAAPQPQQAYQAPGFNPAVYNNTALLAAAGIASHSTDQYGLPSAAHPAAQQIDRSYTLGGGGYASGYGENQVPDHTAEQHDNAYFPSPYPPQPEPARQYTTSPGPIQTNVPLARTNTSPVKGPRNMTSPTQQYSDSPPDYEGNGPPQSSSWGEKR